MVNIFWGSNEEKETDTIKLYTREEDDVWSIVDTQPELLEEYKTYAANGKEKNENSFFIKRRN